MGRSAAWLQLQRGEWLFRSLNRRFVALLKHKRDGLFNVKASVAVHRHVLLNGRDELFTVWDDQEVFPLGAGLAEWEEEVREMIARGFYLEDKEQIGFFLGLAPQKEAQEAARTPPPG